MAMLGRALYQLMHADGVEALSVTEGLQPTAAVVLTVAAEQLLSVADVDDNLERPLDSFDVEGEVLCTQIDVW